MKRLATLLAALALAVTAVGLTAPPAQAGVDNPRILLGSVGGRCALSSGASQTSVTGNPGDTFRVFNLGCGSVRVLFSGGVATGPSSIPNNGSGTYTLGSTAGSGSLLIIPAALGNFLIDVRVTTTPVITPPEKVVPPPHDVLQQVGVPASGACADVPHDTGHVDGFPYGGWGLSWSRWIYSGTGGPVCTRELYFNQSAQEWRVTGT